MTGVTSVTGVADMAVLAGPPPTGPRGHGR
ncbi:hypothetical protein ABH940_006211 [Streptacidiphilus sp. BW17]